MRANFIHPLFTIRWRIAWRIDREVFLRRNKITVGCKHKSSQFDKWLEILAVEDLTMKERGNLNLSEND